MIMDPVSYSNSVNRNGTLVNKSGGAQAKIDNQDISAAIHNYPAALPLSDRNSSEQEKLRI
jgi:hypothetical protein